MKLLLPCMLLLLATAAVGQDLRDGAGAARGPLRVHPENPRYFTDGTTQPDGKPRAVLLTGSHTWNNLIDMGRGDPPDTFGYTAYLDFLEERRHNFIRLWAWDSTTWDTRANGALGKPYVHHVAPLPWLRTGPGNALDGKPKFDLTRFNPAYFERLRRRVDEAGRRGIYVSVMLFEGWGLMHGNRRRGTVEAWAWRSHPFHPANNVNGTRAEGETDLAAQVHRLGLSPTNDLQAAYVRKVVDTVNGYDNVLFEVINEGGERQWDWWVVKTIRDHERSLPKQHPVGLTGHGAEKLADMLASPTDWISPGRNDGYGPEPPAWDAAHRKVSLLDTDHVWGVGGTDDWVWKSFLRGHNPIFMDPYDGAVLGMPNDPRWEQVRRAMGQVRRLAERLDLAALQPADALASTSYCLANPGKEYLVYLPGGGTVSIDLSQVQGELAVEWFSTGSGRPRPADPVMGGGMRQFRTPLEGPAVLHLSAR